MSQLRNMGVNMRAAIAFVAAWALMFSVATTGAVAASANDIVLKNSGAARVGLFACFKRHMTQGAAAEDEKTSEKQGSRSHHCPCCLAAHAAAAVLPDRTDVGIRSTAPPARFNHVVVPSRAPASVALRAVNGARAPPA